LDAYTIRSHFPDHDRDFSGLHIGIVGDILHSRVARSNAYLLSSLGAKVTMVAPSTLIPIGVDQWPAELSNDLDSVIGDLDAVMMLRVQSERMSDSYFPSEREYARDYGLSENRLNEMKKGAIVMHPGPMNRGLEISTAAADSERSVILEQVANGVVVRMAVLYMLLGGVPIAGAGETI